MENLNIQDIPKIYSGQKCWVVRCDSAQYYGHFKKFSTIAIGHIDYINFETIKHFTNNKVEAEEKIKDFLINKRAMDKVSAKRKANSDVNQAYNFISTMNVDDYVVTIGHNSILIGILKKEAYFNKTPLIIIEEIENNTKDKENTIIKEYKMDLSLRREVEWIAELPKRKAPFALLKLFIAPLTIFKIKEPTILFHSIYPMFIFNDDNLHFSILINQKDNIKNHNMLHLLKLLEDIENISKIKELPLNQVDMGKLSDSIIESNLNIKASFMSPGEVFAFLPMVETFNLTTFYAIYSFLFGSKIMGIDGLVPKEARIKIVENYLKKSKKNIKTLDVSAPNYKLKK